MHYNVDHERRRAPPPSDSVLDPIGLASADVSQPRRKRRLEFAFFGPDQNAIHLFWFGAVPFHMAIFRRVAGFDDKPARVQRSFND